jgi:hypothetical protein
VRSDVSGVRLSSELPHRLLSLSLSLSALVSLCARVLLHLATLLSSLPN